MRRAYRERFRVGAHATNWTRHGKQREQLGCQWLIGRHVGKSDMKCRSGVESMSAVVHFARGRASTNGRPARWRGHRQTADERPYRPAAVLTRNSRSCRRASTSSHVKAERCRGCRARGPVWVAGPETRPVARRGYRRSPTWFRFGRPRRGRSEITSLQPGVNPLGSRCPKPVIRSGQRVDFGVRQLESHVAQRRQRLGRPVEEPRAKSLVGEDLPDDELHCSMRHGSTRALRAGVATGPRRVQRTPRPVIA
jgi:hypothetical protein